MPNKTSKKYAPSKKFKSHLESKAKKFDLYKEKQDVQTFLSTWKDDNLPNPFDVTKDFIQEKGLKIYGGLALHKHLKKKKILFMIDLNFQIMMYFHQMHGNMQKSFVIDYIKWVFIL